MTLLPPMTNYFMTAFLNPKEGVGAYLTQKCCSVRTTLRVTSRRQDYT